MFDIGIVAVISAEFRAVESCFQASRDDVRSVDGARYYLGSAKSGALSVVIHCQGLQGNAAAALATERLISTFRPRFAFLVGVAAGRMGKIRIGDVVASRVVVDDTGGVAFRGRRLKRPLIQGPPYAGIQWFQEYRHDENRWHERLRGFMEPPRPPVRASPKRVKWYRRHVPAAPKATDAAIYSSNLLLRDPEVLETHARQTHQQIRVGEMEAAGFMLACQTRPTPTPWYVVRAVSDFGDARKNEEFFDWAAHCAASYLLDLVEEVIRPERPNSPSQRAK